MRRRSKIILPHQAIMRLRFGEMRFVILIIASFLFSNTFCQSEYYSFRLSSSFIDLHSAENNISASRPSVFGLGLSVSYKMSKNGWVEFGASWNSVRLVYRKFDGVMLKLQIPGFDLAYARQLRISRKKNFLIGTGAYYGIAVNYYSQQNRALLPDGVINHRLFSVFACMTYGYSLNERLDVTFDNKLHYGVSRLVPDSRSPIIYMASLGLRFE